MGLLEIKRRAKVVKKFKLLISLLISTTKKASPSEAACCEQEPEEHPGEELVVGRVSVREYLRPSERLVFEPAGTTRSILEAAKVPFPDCVVVAVDTKDPRAGFRASMEEMVEASGLDGSTEQLAELLAWYLRMNVKENRWYIVEAFVEMFTGSCLFGCPAAATNPEVVSH